MTALRAFGAGTFRSLHVRNFRLFFVGQFVSQVGNWLTLVAQTLFVLHLTRSGVALGLLAAAQFLPVLLLGAWGGLVADRTDKRKLLLVVQSLAMLQSFALAALAFSGNPPLWAFYAVAMVGGLTMAIDHPTRRSFVVEMVPEEDINNAVSLNSALMTSSRMLGPALGGLLISTVGFGWAFLGDGLSYLAVLFCLWRINPAELRRPPITPRAKGQVRAGFRYARSKPELFAPIVMMAVVGTLAFNFEINFALFAIRDLHGGDALFTLMLSVASVGSLIAALATARRTTVEISTVANAAIGFGAALALLALVPGVGLAFVGAVLVGLGSVAFLTASTAIVQMRADPSMRGRVLALQAMVFLGSTPIGGPVVGAVAEHFGARYSIGLGAVAASAAGLWGRSVSRRLKAEREAQAATPEGQDQDQDQDGDQVSGIAPATPATPVHVAAAAMPGSGYPEAPTVSGTAAGIAGRRAARREMKV